MRCGQIWPSIMKVCGCKVYYIIQVPSSLALNCHRPVNWYSRKRYIFAGWLELLRSENKSLLRGSDRIIILFALSLAYSQQLIHLLRLQSSSSWMAQVDGARVHHRDRPTGMQAGQAIVKHPLREWQLNSPLRSNQHSATDLMANRLCADRLTNQLITRGGGYLLLGFKELE